MCCFSRNHQILMMIVKDVDEEIDIIDDDRSNVVIGLGL